jgi:hypothetical protein
MVRLPTLRPVLTAPGTPLVAAALLVAIGVAAYWTAFLGSPADPLRLDLNEARYPRQAMGFIKEHRLPAPLFNVYAWGGYELWRLYPDYQVFIDGRTHVYGREVLQDFLEVVHVGPRWPAILDKWGVQTVLAVWPSPLAETLQVVAGWRRVLVDGDIAVYLRDVPAHGPLLARLTRLSGGESGPVPDGAAPGAPGGWRTPTIDPERAGAPARP